MSQPIHETLVPKERPKRFELTWAMIERLRNSAVSEGYHSLIVYSNDTISNSLEQLATALEIILQCKTFGPGVFELRGYRWQRAGELPKE